MSHFARCILCEVLVGRDYVVIGGLVWCPLCYFGPEQPTRKGKPA